MQLIDEKLMELLHTQNRDVSSDKTCDYTVNVLRCNSASCRLATGGTDVRPRTCPNPGRPDSELSATMGGRHQRWVSRVDPTGGKSLLVFGTILAIGSQRPTLQLRPLVLGIRQQKFTSPRTCPNPRRPDSVQSATVGGRHQRWVSRVDPTGGKIATFLWTTRAMKQSTSHVATPPLVARHQGAQIYVPTFHVYVPTQYCPTVCITPLWEGDTKGGSLG